MPDAVNGGAWADEFAGAYRHASLEKWKRRERRRLRAAARRRGRPPGSGATAAREAELAAARARLAARFVEAGRAPGFQSCFWRFVRFHARAGDPDARLVWRAECAPQLAEEHRQQRAGWRTEVRRRLREGFWWPGGPVGGNPAYHRGPFLHPGLVSDEHPVLKLFVASTPRAALLRAGDTKAGAAHCGPKLLALDAPYVEANGAMRRVLRVELDRAFAGGFAGLAAAVASRGVPPPNIVVGHLDGAGRLLHPHLIWLIDSPIAFVGGGRRGPQKLWRAVLRGLTAALLPLGADPGGLSNPLRAKNPLSTLWRRAVLAEAPYHLAPPPPGDSLAAAAAGGLEALAPRLDLDGACEVLRLAEGAAAVRRREGRFAADHPDPAVAGESNSVFRHLSAFARAHVAAHRDSADADEAGFRRLVLDEALRVARAGPAAGAERNAAAMAERIACWTWERYRPPAARPARCGTPAERRTRQAAGQARGAAAKRDATVAACAGAARRLMEDGRRPTQAAVAEATHKSERTVHGHWDAILAAAGAGPAVRARRRGDPAERGSRAGRPAVQVA